MLTLRKTFRFEAAHRLPDHDGKCARLHGHSWLLTVEVQGFVSQFQGPKAGMLVDYGELKQYVQPIVDEYLDHHFLNETLGITSPTSELVAMWVFEVILTALPPRRDRGYRLKAVEIDETCTSSCRFEGVDE